MKNIDKIEAEQVKENEGVVYSNRSYGFFQDAPKMLSRINELEEKGILNKEDAHHQRSQIIKAMQKIHETRQYHKESGDFCRIL